MNDEEASELALILFTMAAVGLIIAVVALWRLV